MTITTYNGTEADFYIQAKGLHAGRPLKNAIPNCFAVKTDIKNAYEIVYSLWKGKAFYFYIGGSVVPFIRITDVKKIVFDAFNKADKFNAKKLEAISQIDSQIDVLKKQLNLMKEMQTSIAVKANLEAKMNR